MNMRVLSVASEAVPLVKTGGLADVVGALPGALAPHGVSLTTLLPGYPAVMAAIGKGRTIHSYPALLGEPLEYFCGLRWRLPLAKNNLGHARSQSAMMVDLREPQVFKGQVPQPLDGVVGRDLALAHLIEKFANGFGVHSHSVAATLWRVVSLAQNH